MHNRWFSSSIAVSYLSRGLRLSRGRLCGAFFILSLIILPVHTTFALYPHGSNDYAYIRSLVANNVRGLPTDTIYLLATAYSSTADQTDDTPCVAAKGFNLCEHSKEDVIATNLLPIGTRVRFPLLDPDMVYTVVDRMHERYNARVDFWKTSRDRAQKFGIRMVKMEVYE